MTTLKKILIDNADESFDDDWDAANLAFISEMAELNITASWTGNNSPGGPVYELVGTKKALIRFLEVYCYGEEDEIAYFAKGMKNA